MVPRMNVTQKQTTSSEAPDGLAVAALVAALVVVAVAAVLCACWLLASLRAKQVAPAPPLASPPTTVRYSQSPDRLVHPLDGPAGDLAAWREPQKRPSPPMSSQRPSYEPNVLLPPPQPPPFLPPPPMPPPLLPPPTMPPPLPPPMIRPSTSAPLSMPPPAARLPPLRLSRDVPLRLSPSPDSACAQRETPSHILLHRLPPLLHPSSTSQPAWQQREHALPPIPPVVPEPFATPPTRQMSAAKLFEAADVNKDGKLDRDEFARFMAACEVVNAAGASVLPR